MTLTWNGTVTALTSIAHGGETRGTITLLRRELVIQENGDAVHVPMISGNHLRGRLRRVGEELLRDTLKYEGQISAAAAHVLRGGGSLVKATREPLSGSRLQRLRQLNPQVAVFGAAGGGLIVDGALDVGKIVPHLVETSHITGVHSARSAFTGTQLEAYSRRDDRNDHDFVGVVGPMETDAQGIPVVEDAGTNLMRFQIETFPAGTTFSTWIRLRRPSPLEAAFMTDVLNTYDGDLGGRIGTGHGKTRIVMSLSGQPPAAMNWREHVSANRAELLELLEALA